MLRRSYLLLLQQPTSNIARVIKPTGKKHTFESTMPKAKSTTAFFSAAHILSLSLSIHNPKSETSNNTNAQPSLHLSQPTAAQKPARRHQIHPRCAHDENNALVMKPKQQPCPAQPAHPLRRGLRDICMRVVTNPAPCSRCAPGICKSQLCGGWMRHG